MAKKLTSDQTLTAILAYLGILAIIPLVIVKKRDDFIRFHLNQGLNLLVIEIILWAASFWIFMIIPFLGWVIRHLFSLVWLLLLIVIIIAIVKALQKEKWVIPIVGNLKIVDIK